MGEKRGLNVRELLEKTYSILCERHKPMEVIFAAPVLTEIADDSDWHRSRTGYMGYQSVGLFNLNGKIWAIGRGEKCGGYPADPYDSDILAIESAKIEHVDSIDEKLKKELSEAIKQSPYFQNSVIYGMADGHLAVSERGRFGKQMVGILQPEIKRFVAQEPKYNDQYFSLSTLSPICTEIAKYKPEFAEFLTDSIEAVLNDTGVKSK